jgi:hypothetical protein
MDRYDQASVIMTNGYLDSVSSEDAYYLFSEGMDERYGKNKSTQGDDPLSSELSGGANEELSASDSADASADEDRNNFDGDTTSMEVVDTDSQPTGGFPPIYIVTRQVKEENTKSKSRELSTRTSAVSIMDILKKKKA